MQNVANSVASNSGLKRMVDWDIDYEMGQLGDRAIGLLDADPSPSGRMNVLLEQSLVGCLLYTSDAADE